MSAVQTVERRRWVVLLLSVLSAASLARAGESEALDCNGRRMYVHNLPDRFNAGLMLKDSDYSEQGKKWYTEQLLRVLERVGTNAGFGAKIKSPLASLPMEGRWYATDQFALEVVFHLRIPYYPCLTDEFEEADLVYVPYYGGLDMSRHMHEDNAVKEALARDLAEWLQEHPAWQKKQGKDHFMVLGRETWDFKKNPDGIWGNNLLNLPGIKENVMTVDVETYPWMVKEYGAPKPTAFHPRTRKDLQTWINAVQAHPRPFFFSLVVGRRPNTTEEGRLRDKLIWQCQESDACHLGDCDAMKKVVGGKWVSGCESPRHVMRVYLKSTFCLHPRGDSCNRRSVLDSIITGCIPVVFEECTLQHQYHWHVHVPPTKNLDADTDKSSPEQVIPPGKFFVHIAHTKVKGVADKGLDQFGDELLLVEKELRKIPQAEVEAMQRKLLGLIPRVTFGGTPMEDGSILPPDFEDAFDIIMDGLLQERRDLVEVE